MLSESTTPTGTHAASLFNSVKHVTWRRQSYRLLLNIYMQSQFKYTHHTLISIISVHILMKHLAMITNVLS